MGGQRPRKTSKFCKEGVLQIVSVTSPVASSSTIHRFKLALRDRQTTRERRQEEGGQMPMAWGCHIDIKLKNSRVGRKNTRSNSNGMDIFCLEWGRT